MKQQERLKMSKQNRLNEYNRLVSLDRQKDIPSDLMKEFAKAPLVKAKVKKNGR